MAKVEPYRPPHLKGKQGQPPLVGTACKLNPKLTPYNARLLANSRKTSQQSGSEVKKVQSPVHVDRTCTDEESVSPAHTHACNHTASDLKPSKVTNVEQQSIQVENSTTCDTKMADVDTVANHSQTACVSTDPGAKEKSLENVRSGEHIIETSKADTAESKQETTDWFEYESTACDIIPIKLPSELNNNVYVDKEVDQPQGKTNSLLHSWFSMDNDVDVQKTDKQLCHDSSQIEVIIHNEHSETPVTDPKQDITSSDAQGKNTEGAEKTVPASVIPSEKDLLSVLYIRRNCQFSKKGRPSSKKRRRQKSKQNDVENADAQNKDEQATSSTKTNSSISFILGLDASPDGKGSSHSFLMTCDVDSDIDWSDSDLEFDSESDSDGATCESLDQFQNCLGLVNFQVSCSMQNTAGTSETTSDIEAVNIAWNVHIRQMEQSSNRKKSSTKKVHFPEGGDLAEVHTETEWSEEYQAARKGPWEEYARDRDRFKRRISDCEGELRPVLASQHRDRVYQERFIPTAE